MAESLFLFLQKTKKVNIWEKHRIRLTVKIAASNFSHHYVVEIGIAQTGSSTLKNLDLKK